MQILIVDDSEAILRIQRYAVFSGFPEAIVRFATTGQEALDLIAEWLPDLVISDYHLTGMDGFQLLLAIRKRFPTVLVGFTTAESSTEIETRVRSAGASFFVRIPFKPDELVDAVRTAISSRTKDGNSP